MTNGELALLAGVLFFCGSSIGVLYTQILMAEKQEYYIEACLSNNNVDAYDLDMISKCKESFEIYRKK